ncbi:hypothetical protein XA68_17270 [Ophiocordyceps unilateralis]|uniref:CHAT domain-containing protein n=1 Tax=Ophiocordyceps unilateralis TaxID=268505 RepID=A0A2A9PQT7_OPHUN|nr:hypothetical protein XA68_17270 [Ophiocordyceps unilateralis]
MEHSADSKLNEPRVFSKTEFQQVDQDTPLRPYITFTTRPGKLQHLVVKIWSHDQGWCNPDLVDGNDAYANSWTWFVLGLVEKTEDDYFNQSLYDFQRNVRASRSMHCHINEWKIGALDEADDDQDTNQLQEFLDSLAQAPSREVGIYPVAQFAGWQNIVWKMEVHIMPCEDWQTDHHGDTTLRRSNKHFNSTRLVSPEEVLSLRRPFVIANAANATMRELEEAIEARRGDESEEAITETRHAINAIPLDHPDRPRWGALEDLQQAISITKQAITAIPTGHPLHSNRWKVVGNLGAQLEHLYERTGEMTDLEEAIDLFKQSIAETPHDNPIISLRVRGLGDVLHLRFSRLGMIVDLEQAIGFGRLALATAGPERRFRILAVRSLVRYLADYFERTGVTQALDEAMRLSVETGLSIPHDDIGQTIFLSSVAGHMDRYFRLTGEIQYQDLATDFYETVLRSATAGIEARMYAGRQLLARPQVLQRGLRSYENAKLAVTWARTIPGSISTADKKHLLSNAVGIASDAAVIALHYDQGPLAAATLLEAGRGILASNVFHLRSDEPELRAQHPELAETLESLQRRLDRPSLDDIVNPGDSLFLSSSMDQRHLDSRRLQHVLDEIRTKDGFQSFRIGYTENNVRWGADCNTQPIRHRTDEIQSIKTLEWLWDDVVEPVLDALGFTSAPSADSWPNIWWIPTGLLSRFPLHAAGYHLDADGRTALDRIVSSYSSSVETIVRTRNRHLKVNMDASLVTVSMKETPGLSPLIYTDDEIDAVRTLCNSGPLRLPVISPRPHRDEIISALKTCTIFHFAGHGNAEMDPLQSQLCLEDWRDRPLKVADLIETDLSSSFPFLAYLSACGTGKNPDRNSADESIHLTSIFQLAGFRHVIGTLWEVDDHLCVDMANMIYGSLGANGLNDASVSLALHRATRTLREEWLCEEISEATRRDVIVSNEEVSKMPLWVPYIHFGV